MPTITLSRQAKHPRNDAKHLNTDRCVQLTRPTERVLASDSKASVPGNPFDRPVEYIDSDEFRRADADATILNDLTDSGPAPRRASRPERLPQPSAIAEELPLLGADLESHLFRKLNYLRFKAAELQNRTDRRTLAARTGKIRELLLQAEEVRSLIARSNLRLVMANARQFCDVDHPFEDLVSDGNLSLLQAIDKFNYTRGFRFSTYATHAIRRAFFRRMAKRQREKSRVAFTSPELLQEVAQPAKSEETDVAEVVLFRRLLRRMSDALSERELQILRARFSLETDADAPTLQALAVTLGICKERVRQLQNRAVAKLRKLADEIRAEFDPDQVTLADSMLAMA